MPTSRARRSSDFDEQRRLLRRLIRHLRWRKKHKALREVLQELLEVYYAR